MCLYLYLWNSVCMVHHSSDPHKFLVTGRICPVSSKETADPLGIYNLLKLQHSIPLVRVLLFSLGITTLNFISSKYGSFRQFRNLLLFYLLGMCLEGLLPRSWVWMNAVWVVQLSSFQKNTKFSSSAFLHFSLPSYFVCELTEWGLGWFWLGSLWW